MLILRYIANVRAVRGICTSSSKPKSIDYSIVKTEKVLVPTESVASKIDINLLPPKTVIDSNTIALLERLSLVDCANKQGIQILEDAITFADQILQVDTTHVDSLITVLEDRPLETREDIVTEGNCRDDILSNASLVEEEYLVAPPGNIPLETRDNLLHEEKSIKN